MTLHPSQPGTVLKFTANPGKGDRLFQLTDDLRFTDPVVDATHDEVIDLLAEQPVRVTVRPAFSGFSS